MCHHRASDWYAERTRDRTEEETDADDTPDYGEELSGLGVDEPEVADPEFEDSEVETPELEDDERPARATSDD